MESPVPLKRYLSLHFLTVAGIPMLVIALLVWLYALPSMRTGTALQHQGMARSISGQISAHLLGGERQLAALADYIRNRSIIPEPDLTALLDAQCGQGDLFETIYLSRGESASIDSLGLASARRAKRDDLLGIDLSGRRFIHNLDQQIGAHWSETFLSTASSRLAVALTIPLGKSDFLAGEITLDRLSELVSHLPLEAGYRILAVDGRGRVVADSQRTRWGQKLDITRLPHDSTSQGRLASGAFELDGTRLLGTVVDIPGPGWKVVVAQSEARVFQPLRNTLTTIAVGLAVALGLALSIAWFQAGRLSNLFRSYAELARKIAQGEYTIVPPQAKISEFIHLGDSLEHMAQMISEREKALVDSEQRLKITLNSIGDAVIATDDSGIVTQLNPIAEQLTGWQAEAAIGQPLSTIFHIVNADSRKAVPNPVEEVLSRGEIVGLANHTVLLSRGGDEYQIADSGAPIRHPDGRIVGVVLVFRDVTESYAQERRIQANEKRLRNLVSNVPGLVFEFTADRSNYLNNTFTGVVQEKAQEILGLDAAPESFFRAFLTCIPESDRESFQTRARAAIERATPWNYEGRFIRPDGEEIWISGHSVPQTAGEQVTFCGVLMDVTRRKWTEESLHITQFSYDAASIGIFRISEDAAIIDANRQACASLGYTKEELCRITVFDIDPDFKPESWPGHIARLRELGSKTIETRHQRKNGEIFPVEILINLMTYEGQEYHLAFVQDITERKRGAEELHRAQAYILNIIDSMPSMLIGVDRSGVVTQWNSKTELATGIPADSARGKTLQENLPWITPQLERLDEAVRSRQVITETKRSRLVDGAMRYEDITLYPLVANGVEGAVIRIDDVTEQVQMEEMMIQSEKMLTVGGLAAGMAHEINNPLAGMLQTANVMANRLGASFDNPANTRAAEAAGIKLESIDRFMRERGIHRMLESISTSGHRIAALVDNMLGLARKSDSEVSECRIEEIIDKTLELAGADYDLKKHHDFRSIAIGRAYAGDLPAVPCQSSKIQQVLLNLFGNSAQAMRNAATVNPRLDISTWLDPEREMVCVSVEDNGPGMDEGTRKRVFEPFFTTKPKGAGTGLGLSVSYFIITENHKGEMLVESSPGKGAKFIMRLPLGRPV
jgi:PAS domain S-box-containing protein